MKRRDIMRRLTALINAYVILLGGLIMMVSACAATPSRESTGGYIDDSTITAKVKTDLAQNPKVSATDVHVKTYKGVVELSGFVNSQSELEEAGRVTRQVAGVQSVHNNLIVKQVVSPPTKAERRTVQ
jgi:hyperosmotically inducible periplasmic protein